MQVCRNRLEEFIKTSTEDDDVGDDVLYVKLTIRYNMDAVLVRRVEAQEDVVKHKE